MTFSLSDFQPNRKTFSQMTFSLSAFQPNRKTFSQMTFSLSAFQPFSQILSAFGQMTRGQTKKVFRTFCQRMYHSGA
jgi:hypothetical protein